MAGIPRLPEMWAAWFDSALRPLNDFYQWCQTVDDRIRAGGEDLEDGLDTKAGLPQTWEITFQVAKVTTAPITAILKSKRARVVTEIVTDCISGTCTLTGTIDGVNLGGSANSVSTTETEQAHASANTVAVGQNLVLTPSGISACLNMVVRIGGTYALDA